MGRKSEWESGGRYIVNTRKVIGRIGQAVIGIAALFVVSLVHTPPAAAQEIHLTGQSIQPVYEGWERNADGTISMIFGYLNRNYAEAPDIPTGPNNGFSPGPEDRGQPTHFYQRRQSFMFRVIVPADWGDKRLVWTINHHGQAATAVGKLLPAWEVNEGVWNATRVGVVTGSTKGGNTPPAIKVVGSETATVAVGEPLTLTVSASDDGKPGPQRRPVQPGGRSAAPTSKEGDESLLTTTGLPVRTIGRTNPYMPRDKVDFSSARATGLAVTWIQWRGPGAVSFEPMLIPIKSEGTPMSGTAKTTARFSEPGTYVVRAYADEGVQTRYVDVKVTVTAKP